MRSDSGSTFTERARREQITAGAIRVVAECGYAQASVAKIADHIGVAKSVVLYHFKTKDDIMEAVVAAVFLSAMAEIAPAMAAASTPADRLAAYIRSNIAFIDANRSAATAMLEIITGHRPSGCSRSAQTTAVGSPPVDEGLAALDPEPIFAEGMSSGEFRPLSPRFMKNALRAALDGAVWELSRDPGYNIVGYGEELVVAFELATRRQS